MMIQSVPINSLQQMHQHAYPPRRVRLTNCKTGEAIHIELTEPVIIGRNLSGVVVEVDIDLMSIGGFRLGISRQHLQMIVRGQHVMVCDLQSSNGTSLNGARLKPMTYYPIKHGDILQLCRLRMRVDFEA